MQFDHAFETIYPLTTGVDSVTLGGTTQVNLPAGTTAQRGATPLNGSTRYNQDTLQFETYQNGSWTNFIPYTSQPAKFGLFAPLGAAGLPTWRLQALGEHSDVIITAPVLNQVVLYNGTTWINSNTIGASATGTVGVANSGGGTGWTLVSGSTYTANFVHGLGTTNIVITVYDTNNSSVIIPSSTVITDTNTVTITAIGNTKTLKVVVVANGQALGIGTSATVITAKDGGTVTAATNRLNFTGQAVNVTDAGAGQTNIAIGSRSTFFANSLDTPNNADWTINAFAPVVTDPTYASLNVRQFSSTAETGVGFLATVPTGASIMNIKVRGRGQVAVGTASVVQFRVYSRMIPNNAPMGAWTAALDLNNLAVTASNTNFLYFLQTLSLASVGLVGGNTYQFELTRRVATVGGTQLATNFLVSEVTFEFL